jgi:hypothetical protein
LIMQNLTNGLFFDGPNPDVRLFLLRGKKPTIHRSIRMLVYQVHDQTARLKQEKDYAKLESSTSTCSRVSPY